MVLIDASLESILIEHPNRKDVLAIVPDVQNQPTVIDVIDCKITDPKDGQMHADVNSVSEWHVSVYASMDGLHNPPADGTYRN